MRILLTGAAGFIGSHLAEALLAAGDEVVGYDSFDPYYAPSLKEENVAGLERWPGFSLVRADVRDASRLERLLGTDGFDAVVHLAARAGVRPSIADPVVYMDVNVRGTTLLVDAARRHGVRRFVVASSSSVYGAASTPPFAETERADRPVSPYAASKRAAELSCSSLADLHGLSIVSLRYFTVYGPRQRPDMAIAQFIDRIGRGEPIQRYGDGSMRRDYTYVDDAVHGTVRALHATGEGWTGHRAYNIGESRTTSLVELVALLEREVGRPAVVEERPAPPGDVPLTYADLTAARRDLGYDPKVPIEEGLARHVAWHRARTTGTEQGASS